MDTLNALTDFGRALIAAGVDPGTVEVSLPALQWERLAKALQAETGGRSMR